MKNEPNYRWRNDYMWPSRPAPRPHRTPKGPLPLGPAKGPNRAQRRAEARGGR